MHAPNEEEHSQVSNLPPGTLFFASLSPEEKLDWVFRFVKSPLPKRGEDWSRVEEEVISFYIATVGHGFIAYGKVVTEDTGGVVKDEGPILLLTKNVGPPPPLKKRRKKWIRTLQREAGKYLQDFYANLTGQKGDSISEFPSAHYTRGTRYSLIKGGRVFHVYASQNAIGAFLLMLGDLLAEVDVSKIQLCTVCSGFFYKVKRQKYCSAECKQQALPAKDRVRKSRERRAKWEQSRGELELLLDDMDAIARKEKLQRPRSERQVLEEAEKALEKARTAFAAAFPRRKGQGYEEGKKFFADAEKKILRPRKRVKGY